MLIQGFWYGAWADTNPPGLRWPLKKGPMMRMTAIVAARYLVWKSCAKQRAVPQGVMKSCWTEGRGVRARMDDANSLLPACNPGGCQVRSGT